MTKCCGKLIKIWTQLKPPYPTTVQFEHEGWASHWQVCQTSSIEPATRSKGQQCADSMESAKLLKASRKNSWSRACWTVSRLPGTKRIIPCITIIIKKLIELTTSFHNEKCGVNRQKVNLMYKTHCVVIHNEYNLS